MPAIPPLETEAEALALPAVRAIHEAYREGRSTLAEGNAAEIRRVLTGAGVELGAYDEHLVEWFAGWEVHVIAGVLCRWITGAHEAGKAED